MSRTRLAISVAFALALALAIPALAASPMTPFVLTKTCDGAVCIVDTSDIAAIPPDSEIDYFGPQYGTPVLSSRVVINGVGGTATGHCTWALTPSGTCTFAQGTGSFAGFHANLAVTSTDFIHFTWTGRYQQ